MTWLLLAVLAVVVTIVTVTAPPPLEDRARAIGSQIRCPVCQGESIADSPAETARNMMDLVRDRVAEGRTDREITDELLASYTGAVLLDPPASGPTLWLWLAPVIALAIGLVMVSRRFQTTRNGSRPEARTPPPTPIARRRWVLGALFLVLAGAVTVAAVGQNRQARPEDQGLAGVAGEGFDPDSVSNETMEAVIAANVENPEINGMRLALANRYFEEGAYQSAFVHFEAVLDSDPDATEAAVAYTRLGWMVYDGNGETELGLDLIERGLELVPEDAFGLYLKGRVVWCGLAQPAEAESIFEQVLTTSGLDPNVTEQVEADLAAASAGEECSS